MPARSRHRFLSLIDSEIATDTVGQGALLIVNIRHLRDINIALGSTPTDLLLQYFEGHLRSLLRPTDRVLYLGGDEYGVFLKTLPSGGVSELAAAKIHNSVRPALDLRGQEIPLRLNIGIALYPQHGSAADALLRNAQIALAEARQRDSETVIYEDRFNNSGLDVMAIRKGLRYALDHDQLALYYQPKIAVASGKLFGMEALARWHNENGKPIGPDVFIPIAEQSDLIEPFTFWSLNCALRQCMQYSDHLSVAVNMSAKMLQHPNLVDLVQRAINIWGTPAGKLTLEITESAMMRDPITSLITLKRLHELGVTLSIDDFGTGYSSLAYLQKLPIQELKIDKSFVLNMHQDRGDETIVRAIIDLSHNLGLTVVAEGVETEITLNKLKSLGCDYAQGYYIAKPMPVTQCMQWLASDAKQSCSQH